MSLEIDKVLVLSTHHLPGEICLPGGSRSPAFGEARMDGISNMTGEFGWLCWAGDADNKPQHYSPRDPDRAAFKTLDSVLAFARENDCNFVRFDRNGSFVAGLPTFDW